MKQLLIRMANRNDLVLAVLLVCIIFMMVLPLPATLVDMLIAMNLAVTVVLLMASVYLKDVTELSAFPSMLLLTTLFRLALSITTTRLILLDGHAGHIIETFGRFVVGGNLIVGLVVFFILTIVNFLVITKGSERVAEVSARFSLDSMPGKQMSIDSDMRAGVIDLTEAKHRRELLEQESQLYGAMDGAMKFVKGDAIAGMIIIAINLAGGISIGILQKGLSTSQALNLYALLTVGDGLIAQIPALFVSITAGFIVTRVSAPESRDLASDIIVQLFSQPRGLLVTAAILLVFAAIPGFPTLIFLGLAATTGAGGYLRLRSQEQGARKTGQDAFAVLPGDPAATAAGAEAGRPEAGAIALTVPIIIDIATGLGESIGSMLNREIAQARRGLYFDLGVPFPNASLRLNDTLAPGQYRILINEVPAATGEVRPGEILARETEENLSAMNIPFATAGSPLPDIPGAWVQTTHSGALQKAGIPILQPERVIAHHLAHVLRRQAQEFLGVQETMHILNQMQGSYGELVKEVMRLLPVTTITDVLQRLVNEDISIRDMRTILEALVAWGQREKDPIILTEHVRSSLARYITNKYSSGTGFIPAYILAKQIEDTIRAAIRQTSGASYLALEPADHRSLIEAIRNTVRQPASNTVAPVILAPIDIRRFTRKAIEREFPRLPVLSYQELSPTVNIQPLDRISFHRDTDTKKSLTEQYQ